MQTLLALAQSVSMDQAVETVAGAGIAFILLFLVIVAAITGLIVGLILKLVGQGVLGYTLRYGSCFLAVFIYVLVAGIIGLTLSLSGLVTVADVTEARSSGMAQLMPYGIKAFAISQAIGLLVLTWAIRSFVKSPSGASPGWGSSFVIAIIVLLVCVALNYALTMSGVGAGSV